MIIEYLKLLTGFILLIAGSEVLIRGGVGLANKLKIPAMLVGVTIIAFGTSLPELIVSLNAGFKGNDGISVGNVVGSNIANILLILGLSCSVRPLVFNTKFINIDNFFLFLSTILFIIITALYGNLPRFGGILLLITFIIFMYFSINNALQTNKKNKVDQLLTEDELQILKKGQPILVSLFYIITGLSVLVFGADTLVNSAVIIARSFGVSEVIIGLTLVSIGTSLPELAASIMAAVKKENEMALGNIIGSNIFNILLILGTTASVIPLRVDEQIIKFDNFVMLAATIIFLGFLAYKRIPRSAGLIFTISYFLYLYHLYLIN